MLSTLGSLQGALTGQSPSLAGVGGLDDKVLALACSAHCMPLLKLEMMSTDNDTADNLECAWAGLSTACAVDAGMHSLYAPSGVFTTDPRSP